MEHIRVQHNLNLKCQRRSTASGSLRLRSSLSKGDSATILGTVTQARTASVKNCATATGSLSGTSSLAGPAGRNELLVTIDSCSAFKFVRNTTNFNNTTSSSTVVALVAVDELESSTGLRARRNVTTWLGSG